jgi:hypothetical protein
MALAGDFDAMLEALPSDWTNLELDLRIFDEQRYIDAAVLVVTCNAQPYSHHDWHWRILSAQHFGHAAAPQAVRTALRLLDQAGIDGEIALRELRSGRVENIATWGRPESFRQEFRKLRGQ